MIADKDRNEMLQGRQAGLRDLYLSHIEGNLINRLSEFRPESRHVDLTSKQELDKFAAAQIHRLAWLVSSCLPRHTVYNCLLWAHACGIDR
jgi:hypothetical protein